MKLTTFLCSFVFLYAPWKRYLVGHAECDVGDVTYGMRQILSYLDDMGLRGKR